MVMKKKTAKRCSKTVKSSKKGKYECKACGLLVTVENECGCSDGCGIICCGENMKLKK